MEDVPNSTNVETITSDDASWILTNSFLILTMQSGFALLEAGCVSSKNVANIVMKNTVDIVVGGLSYWMFGYGLSFGRTSTPLFGTSDFFVNEAVCNNGSGTFYSRYMFQFAFAATSTTIVSGAIAERIKFNSYLLLSFLNTFIYSFPANWIWNKNGFLKSLGFLDFAGGCAVHFSGGVVSLIGTLYLGPRMNRFTESDKYSMSSPVTALTGTLMLWWAWLGFNCGSTFGVHGEKWKLAGLVAANTMNGSIGGGLAGLLLSFILRKKTYNIGWFITSILGALVSVTGACAYITPFSSLFVGFVGGAIAVAGGRLLEKLKIDDPVGVIPIHLFSSIWGMVAIGLLGRCDEVHAYDVPVGFVCSGSLCLLGIQILGLACTFVWCSLTALGLFWGIDNVFGLRMSEGDEFLGADWIEHGIMQEGLASAMRQSLHNGGDQDAVIRMIKEDMNLSSHGQGIGPIFEPGQVQLKGVKSLILAATKMFKNVNASVVEKNDDESEVRPDTSVIDSQITDVQSKRKYGRVVLDVGSLMHPNVPQIE